MRLLALLLTIATPALPAIRWFNNLGQASALAKETGRPMMVEFWADWCQPCKVMDATVYSDESVAEMVNRKVVPVRIHFDVQREVARQFNTTAIPYLAFTNSHGTELMHHRGILGVQDFKAVVNAIPSDVRELNRLDQELRRNPDDFDSLLAMASTLRAAGFLQNVLGYYERALKRAKPPDAREFVLRELGRTALDLKDGKRAVRAFERAAKDFPQSPHRPETLLRLAQAYKLNGQEDRAREQIAALKAEYPHSEAARRSKP